MDKIIIEDGDYCKNCKLVDRYNELIDINNEHQKINGELREEIKLLNKMNEENYEKYCNELKIRRKVLEYIDRRDIDFASEEHDILEKMLRGNK